MPLGKFAMLPAEPTFAAIEAAGGQIARHADVHAVAGGLFLSSGDIPRSPATRPGSRGTTRGGTGGPRPDPEIHDERFLAARVRGRGTTVLSACSHAGIVNVGSRRSGCSPDSPSTCCWAATTWQDRPWRTGSTPPSRTSPTSSHRASSRRVIAPAGEPRAPSATAFGPSGFASCVVGAQFILQAALVWAGMSPGLLRSTVLNLDITSGASLRDAAGPVSDTEHADTTPTQSSCRSPTGRAQPPIATNRRRVIVGSARARSW